jgi:iron complex transport system ATP-binding protein
VMHDLALAARFADDVVLLDEGRIAASGAPGDVLSADRLAGVFGIEARVAASATGALTVEPLRAL